MGPTRVNSDFGHLQHMTPRAGRNALLAAAIALSLTVVAALLWWPDEPPSPASAGPRQPQFAAIPKVDVHVHFGLDQHRRMLEIMDAQGIAVALNASGGTPGGGLERSASIAEQTGGRLRPYCNIAFSRATGPGWEDYARDALTECARLGAVGLKIFKSLGLGITDADGSLLAVDDPRLDPAFEQAGELGLPVLIHAGDPQAFFQAPNPDNERHAELTAHPSWSFHGERPGATGHSGGGGRWPTWQEVFAQYERRVARHPGTTFVGAHFGNAPEEPARISRMLDQYPNLVIETGARIPEIGRHPAAEMRRLFVRHADRILFGTDIQVTDSALVLGSAGAEPDPPSRIPPFFRAHFRYFETERQNMAHPTPIQGDWTIDGIGLPEEVLEKLYWRNAVRVFDLPEPLPPPTPQ